MSPDRRAFRHDHRSFRAGLYVLLLATSLAAAASDPRPDHGSTFIDPNVVLLWSGPENPPAVVLGYRVYLSTSQSAVEQAQISAFVDSTVPDVSACPIGALAFDTTYYWRIDAFLATGDTLPGDVWFFTTEPLDIPGVVVHHSPASSGIYLGSPAVVALADGAYLAKCDEFGPGSTYNKTLLFRSSDSGRTWQSLSSVQPMFWATPFAHNGALYLFGVTGRLPASTILCRSDDSGESWTSPGDSHSGLLFSYSISNAPAVHIVHNGRIWLAMSDGGGNSTTGAWCSANRMFLLSAPADSDLLEATRNWSLSPKLDFDAALESIPGSTSPSEAGSKPTSSSPLTATSSLWLALIPSITLTLSRKSCLHRLRPRRQHHHVPS